MLDGEERADQVDAQDFGPIFGRLLEDRGEPARDAGVGEDDVEAAMFRDRMVDEVPDVLVAPGVGADDAVGLGDVGGDDLGAFASE